MTTCDAASAIKGMSSLHSSKGIMSCKTSAAFYIGLCFKCRSCIAGASIGPVFGHAAALHSCIYSMLGLMLPAEVLQWLECCCFPASNAKALMLCMDADDKLMPWDMQVRSFSEAPLSPFCTPAKPHLKTHAWVCSKKGFAASKASIFASITW